MVHTTDSTTVLPRVRQRQTLLYQLVPPRSTSRVYLALNIILCYTIPMPPSPTCSHGIKPLLRVYYSDILVKYLFYTFLSISWLARYSTMFLKSSENICNLTLMLKIKPMKFLFNVFSNILSINIVLERSIKGISVYSAGTSNESDSDFGTQQAGNYLLVTAGARRLHRLPFPCVAAIRRRGWSKERDNRWHWQLVPCTPWTSTWCHLPIARFHTTTR